MRFETQLGELTSPVVIEFDVTSLRVLTIRGRHGEMVKLLMSRAGATPEFLEAPSRLELGDLVVAQLTSRPVRAFALPEGVVALRFRPGVLLVRAVADMIFASLPWAPWGCRGGRGGSRYGRWMGPARETMRWIPSSTTVQPRGPPSRWWTASRRNTGGC